MPDVINHVENTETGNTELWITIKDASDLLGISERHTWRILLQNAWKTQKLPNKDRKKTYVLRQDVEKYYKSEQERQRLEQLKSSPSSDTYDIPDTSDKPDLTGLLDKPDIANKELSDIKNLPILVSDYKNTLVVLQKKQEQLIAKATLWKTSTIWLVILAVFISGFMGFFLFDTKKAMSDNKRDMSDMINYLSDNNRVMSDRINGLSDKVIKAKNDLLITKEVVFEKERRINELVQLLSQEEKVKGKEE